MNVVLGICAVLVLLSNLYALSVARRAKRDAVRHFAEANTQRTRAETAEKQLLVLFQESEAWIQSVQDATASIHVSTALLAMIKAGREHWKGYALALEVLCECCAEGDGTGARNAQDAVERERDMLRFLGEYDD